MRLATCGKGERPLKRKRGALAALAALMALCLALSGCTVVGPKNKTMMLREPSAEPAETASSGAGSFEIKKQYSFPLDKLNQSGLEDASGMMVVDWLDNDNLLVLAAVADENGQLESELGSMSCQYGFYNPILRIEGQMPDCVSLSPDKKTVSYQMQNEEVGKYTLLYSLEKQRQVLSCDSFRTYSTPVWSEDGQTLALASVVNGEYGLTLINVQQGSTRKLREEDEEVLAVLDYYSDESVLIQRETGEDGTVALEIVNTTTGQVQSLFTGRVTQANALSGQSALVLNRNTLRYISVDGSQSAAIESSVQAYAISPDGLYVAVAVQNLDGTVDVTVGRWSGTHIINKKVIYKNIGDTVSRMLFSPNSLRLYVEGPLNASGRPTSATVLEFS